MFQKLARATVIAASLILVISRIFFSTHPQAMRAGAIDRGRGSESPCIFSQLPARRS